MEPGRFATPSDTGSWPQVADIFICGDQAQAVLLDSAAGALRSQGHRVERGPAPDVGTKKTYTERERAALIDPADLAVFTNRHLVTRALMAGAPKLRGICFPVSGVESLDIPAANDLGLIIGHGRVRGNAIGMAEATVMLMLMLLYRVETNIKLLNAQGWGRPERYGRSLEGKTVGLIGFGRIAREVAARLLPFNIRLLTVSPRARQEDLPAGVTKVDLPTLLGSSNVVCVMTGLTPETRQLVGATQLAMMKPDAFIVNTGRGEVIDEDALYDCLRDHRIAGAALDTFTIEPLPADSPLRTLDNVILTPHCVGHTVEGMSEFGPALVENIRCILAGELPLYCKNPEAEATWRERLRMIAGVNGGSP